MKRVRKSGQNKFVRFGLRNNSGRVSRVNFRGGRRQ